MAGPMRVLSGGLIHQFKPHFGDVPEFCGGVDASGRSRKIQSQQTSIEGASRTGEARVLGFVGEKSEILTGRGGRALNGSYRPARGICDEIGTTIGGRRATIFLRGRGAEADGCG